MRSRFMGAEVFRFLDRTEDMTGVIGVIEKEFGLRNGDALDIYNDWMLVRHKEETVTFKAPLKDTLYGRQEGVKVFDPRVPMITLTAEGPDFRVTEVEPGRFQQMRGFEITTDSLYALQREVVEWADKTFPDRTLSECFNKLTMDELPEVYRNPTSPEEYADLIVLILDMAELAVREHNARLRAALDVSDDQYLMEPIDIIKAVRAKMAVNRTRVWVTDPVTGLRQHVPNQTNQFDDRLSCKGLKP